MTAPGGTAAGGAQAARMADPDRFLAALFVPAARRDAAFALIAFNDALVRAAGQPASRSGAGPIAALIRLQWWREVLEGGREDWRGNAEAVAIRALLDDGTVPAAELLGIVAAREAEAEGIETIAAWREAMLGGAGGMQRALGAALGVGAGTMPQLAAAGAAYGCGALRRHLAAVLRSGRCPLPDEMLAAGGTDRATLLQDPAPARLAPIAASLATEGLRFIAEAGLVCLPRGRVAAALPLVLARRDVRREPLQAERPRGVGDRLAMLRAGLAGRVG